MSPRKANRADAGAKLVLRLYIAGDAPNGAAARDNLRAVLARYPDASVRLEIVDVMKDPERGLRDGVVLTPMLIKLTPAPTRRVVGNLRDETVVLAALDLRPSDNE